MIDEEQDASGAAYVVYGKADSSPVGLDLVEAGIGGFAMVGSRSADSAGASVGGGGDINGDGFFDVVVGAPGVGPGDWGDSPGSTYVVFNPLSPDTTDARIK